MSRRVLYDASAGGGGGGGETQHRTFSALAAALGSGADDDKATLYGPAKDAGMWRRTSTGVYVLESPLRPQYLDGSELANGSDVEAFNGAANPTWATPGASGGMLLDGSGARILTCLGALDPASFSVQLRGVVSSIANVANNAIMIGAFNQSRSKAFFGGAAYSGSAWYRKYAEMSTSPTIGISGSSLSALDVALVQDDEFVATLSWAATDAASNTGSYFASFWRGDETPTSVQSPSSAGTSSVYASATDHEIAIFCNGAGMGIRITEIRVAVTPKF